MNKPPEWDPRVSEVLADPVGSLDTMRRRCPVAHSDYLHYSVFRHTDVLRILADPDTFSSNASRHVSVPNSMDPPEHGVWRQVIEPYFEAERLQAFAAPLQAICEELIAGLPRATPVEIMYTLAHPFALRAQCTFLGWPAELREPLLHWVDKKNTATLSGDKHAIAAVATEFDATIRALLAARRAAGSDAPDDLTTRLLHETVHGRPIREAEIVSILRNWTVGELGTIASSVGIIAWYLARHPSVQALLRRQPDKIRAANDEILRIRAPLAANRRRTTRLVNVGGTRIAAGERMSLSWASANRDEAVFGDPDAFRLDRPAEHNLLYGAGIHACPGAGLARLELATMTRSLLEAFASLEPAPSRSPSPATYPASGWREAWLVLHAA